MARQVYRSDSGCSVSRTVIANVGEAATAADASRLAVSTHRARILEKMHVRTNAELIRYVIENDDQRLRLDAVSECPPPRRMRAPSAGRTRKSRHCPTSAIRI